MRADSAGQPRDASWYDAGPSDRAGRDLARPDIAPGDRPIADRPPQDQAELDVGTGDTTALDTGCPACGDVTLNGECDGTVLRFCDDNCLITRDCATQQNGPYRCGLMPPETDWYECLAGLGQPCEPDYWECTPGLTCNGNYPCDPALDLVCEAAVCAEAVDAGATDN